MSAIDLTTLLQLVGRLSDSEAAESASGRFWSYVRENACRVSEFTTAVSRPEDRPGRLA